MSDAGAVTEMRLVVTAADYPAAITFYRDVLGLREHAEFISDGGGHVTILEAGRATLEISDERNAEFVDEVEVGRRVASHIRVAFEVPDPAGATRQLVDAGAELIAEPTVTPWNSVNSRLAAPADLQLTLFGPVGTAPV
jgi:lactoylglutathione lyase